MWRVYGLKNCDTCRKAMKWLEAEGVEAEFVDVRADGLNADDLTRWADALGWDALVNRRSTTWRGLSDADKAAAEGDGALSVLLAHPSLMKRPVFEKAGKILVGFSESQKTAIFGE